MVEVLRHEFPIAAICEVLDYPRSQFYYQAQAPVDETDIQDAIRQIAGQYPTYGYRRVTQQLQRQGQGINHKRVARLMAEMGLMGKPPRKRKRTTNSNHEYRRYPNRVMNLAIERPDQVWVGDITYIRLQDEFVYLAVLMDVFTRSIRGWHLARTMEQSLTLRALEKGLEKGVPEIHHSDQGVQYAATAYVDLLNQHDVVDLSEYRNFAEAYEEIGRFLEDVYMRRRIHSSLGYLTPSEYEMKWNEQKKDNYDIKEEST
jgi:putative transposase